MLIEFVAQPDSIHEQETSERMIITALNLRRVQLYTNFQT